MHKMGLLAHTYWIFAESRGIKLSASQRSRFSSRIAFKPSPGISMRPTYWYRCSLVVLTAQSHATLWIWCGEMPSPPRRERHHDYCRRRRSIWRAYILQYASISPAWLAKNSSRSNLTTRDTSLSHSKATRNARMPARLPLPCVLKPELRQSCQKRVRCLLPKLTAVEDSGGRPMHAWNTNAESSMPGLEMRNNGAVLLVQRWPPFWLCKIGCEPKCITLKAQALGCKALGNAF